MSLGDLILLVHGLSALLWVGGAVAIPVGALALRRRYPDRPEERTLAIHALGRRLAFVMWPAIAVAIATGIGNLRYFLPAGTPWYTSASTPWFLAKFGAIALAVGASGVHSFWLAPRTARQLRSGVRYAELRRELRLSRLLGYVSLAATLAIVLFAFGLAGSG